MWELQRHMHSYIAPSVMAHAERQDDPLYWLETTYSEQRVDELFVELPSSKEELVAGIAAEAIVYDSTTNGGHEVYLHSQESIPWCDEDTYQCWYA